MTEKEFSRILSNRLTSIKSVLAAKADEYAKEDRLYNFKMAAAASRTTPAKACIGMLVKHWVSVLDLVDDHDAGLSDRVSRMVDEKIGDAVNYLILLEAILKGNKPSGQRADRRRGRRVK